MKFWIRDEAWTPRWADSRWAPPSLPARARALPGRGCLLGAPRRASLARQGPRAPAPGGGVAPPSLPPSGASGDTLVPKAHPPPLQLLGRSGAIRPQRDRSGDEAHTGRAQGHWTRILGPGSPRSTAGLQAPRGSVLGCELRGRGGGGGLGKARPVPSEKPGFRAVLPDSAQRRPHPCFGSHLLSPPPLLLECGGAGGQRGAAGASSSLSSPLTWTRKGRRGGGGGGRRGGGGGRGGWRRKAGSAR